MNEHQCPVCMEPFSDKDEYIAHLHDEFDEHQTSADMAADELRELGEEL